MINIEKAKKAFKNFLEQYNDKNQLGFELKVIHTYHVVENARKIAVKLNLSDEDIYLAELIGLLHDIGRFEEITSTKQFDSVSFDHASCGVKMLFENNLIRDFIEEDNYDEIIKYSIENHNKLSIQGELNDKCLLHSKIIRDADKLDNFRVKKEEDIRAMFPGKVKNEDDLQNSTLSSKVFTSIKNKKCVNIRDRVTILDYWVCVLAFIFDLNFKETFEIVKDNDYINILIDRFNYNDLNTKREMEYIRNILNDFIDSKIV